MINIVFLILFFIVAGLHILITGLKKTKFQYIFKPLLIPLLILYYLFTIPLENVDWLIIAGLTCGLIGNIFLMYHENEENFLNGIIVLLIGHVFYILSFIKGISNISEFLFWKLFLLIPGTLILIYVFLKFKGEISVMKIVMLVYMAVITVMYVSSVFRLSTSFGLEYWFVWIGALLYMLSSALIAVDTFHKKIPHTGVYILSTYFLAQFFITQGIIFTNLLL